MHLRLLLVIAIARSVLAFDTVSVTVNGAAEPPFYVTSHLYSPDGSMRIHGCSDGLLRMYDITDTSRHTDIPINTAATIRIQFTLDNTTLLAFQSDSTLFRVEPVSGTVAHCAITKSSVWNTAAFSPDGKKCVVFVPKDSSHVLVDLESGVERTCLDGLPKPVLTNGIRFTPSGDRLLIIIPADSSVQLRSTANDSLLHRYKFGSYVVEAAAFSPDAEKFVVPLYDPYSQPQNSLVIINVETGDTIRSIPAQTAQFGIGLRWTCNGLSFSPDGSEIIAGDDDQIAVWSAETGSRLWSQRYGHTHDSYSCWFTPDSKSVVIHRTDAGAGFDSLTRWDFAGNKKTVLSSQTYWPPIQVSGFSSTGDVVHLGCYYYDATNPGADYQEWDSVVCWNATTNTRILPANYQEHGATVNWFFTPNGNRLVKIGYTRTSPRKMNQVAIFDFPGSGKELLTVDIKGQLTISQDRQFIYLFDSTTWKSIDLTTLDSTKKQFSLPDGWTAGVVHRQTNLVFASLQQQKSQFDTVFYRAGIWNLETGVCINQFLTAAHSWMDHGPIGIDAAFLPDGNTIVISDAGYTYDTSGVALFDIHSGKRLLSYPYARGNLDFSLTPDGKQLIVGAPAQNPGVFCFDATSGGLQRVYTTNYSLAALHSNPFPLNPVQQRQFIFGNKTGELPPVTAVVVKHKKGGHDALRILSVTKKNVTFILPDTYRDAALSIYLLNGRLVARTVLLHGTPQKQSIPLPGLSQGVYTYRVRNSDHTWDAKGKFVVP